MIYRTEYPKPQFERKNWQNLNGEWQFEIDHGNSGESRGLYKADAILNSKINVPFCPESKLSGIEYVDFMSSIWYKREFTLSDSHLSGRVFIHFGAVDYFATIYINGIKCGSHKGGYLSFCFDITEYVTKGLNIVTVHAEDDTRSPIIPSGKQSPRYESHGCSYTRTTGIWQTVWLEFTPKTYIKKVKYYPDVDNGSITVHADLCGKDDFFAVVYFNGIVVGSYSSDYSDGAHSFTIELSEKHLWEVGKGNLYDIAFRYGEDEVKSYFGLRKINIDKNKFLINDKPVFQRLVLDQGFYPNGIYTAPSDAELERDIDLSISLGFNGARLHEKVFEERFLYHCDKKGYIVWGEFPDWGVNCSLLESIYGILPEWAEEVERDFNHPSIIGWCPFNETWAARFNGSVQHNEVIQTVYDMTKLIDPTRPTLDSSGGRHVERTDIIDSHNYNQNPDIFATYWSKLGTEGLFYDPSEKKELSTRGLPFFVSEYGGIRWSEDQKGWGYGDAPTTEEEFIVRLKGLTDALLDNPHIFGFCYTQLTDVEQEQNGLLTYDRKPKFEPIKIRPILSKKAAYEDE